jgi:hypothetical protein
MIDYFAWSSPWSIRWGQYGIQGFNNVVLEIGSICTSSLHPGEKIWHLDVLKVLVFTVCKDFMIPSLKIVPPLNTIVNDVQKLLIWHIADLADIQP